MIFHSKKKDVNNFFFSSKNSVQKIVIVVMNYLAFLELHIFHRIAITIGHERIFCQRNNVKTWRKCCTSQWVKKIFKKSKIKDKNIILFLDNPVQVLSPEKALTLDDVEANLKHLRAELHEAKSRNIYLYNLVEEQKRYTYRKLALYRYI